MRKKITTHANLGYQALQKDNRIKRDRLSKADQAWLKFNGYNNVGWNNVIALFDKIQNLIELTKWSLEDLLLEVDRIGEKYQTPEEINSFQVAMVAEAEHVSDLIDQLFPDTEPEVIKFSHNHTPKKWKNSNKQKTYYTTKS
jgi:hypothetical protein